MKRYWFLFRLLFRLGIANIVRIAFYRGAIKFGYYRKKLPLGISYRGPFFIEGSDEHFLPREHRIVQRAERVLTGELPYYSSDWRDVGFPPRWAQISGESSHHWTHGDEFSNGDIKDSWEPSRFSGLMLLAQAACCTGESRYILACNAWLESWVSANPCNVGAQWKCAQECALRLMATVLSADLLERHAGFKSTAVLHRFMHEHARRILPTMLYAIAQDNNHATSEAAGLYVAGAYMRQCGKEDDESKTWLKTGREAIEARLRRLVLSDGSFAQHSVTYHRLMLDTLSMAEMWRHRINDLPWSEDVRTALAKATLWLECIIDPISGDAPNLGANDGARFFALDPTPYRDFRACADLAARLFLLRKTTIVGADGTLVTYLGLSDLPRERQGLTEKKAETIIYPEGGYVVWKFGLGQLLFRLPHFIFRPAHSDVHHLDLFWRGVNLLRDGGSFSYNSIPDRSSYFSGVASHNTAQFDEREQMPRISRFLWGEWPKGKWKQKSTQSVSSSYVDWQGGWHERTVLVNEKTIQIDDDLSGFQRGAVIRWRLPCDEWLLEGQRIVGRQMTLCISGNVPVIIRLSTGEESRHYQEILPIRVIEIEITKPGQIVTKIVLE